MPRVNVVKKARTDIYQRGLTVQKIHKSGKNAGKEYCTKDYSKPTNENDVVIINKGEAYYWWKFAFDPTTYRSKTHPKRSQLTKSDFLSQIYDIEDRISDISADSSSDLESEVEDIRGDLDSLKSETEDKLYNMPDQLQYAPTGEMLQNRIDELDNMINELECIDYSDLEMCEDDITEDDLEEGEEIEEALERILQERIEEKISNEISAICYNGE